MTLNFDALSPTAQKHVLRERAKLGQVQTACPQPGAEPQTKSQAGITEIELRKFTEHLWRTTLQPVDITVLVVHRNLHSAAPLTESEAVAIAEDVLKRTRYTEPRRLGWFKMYVDEWAESYDIQSLAAVQTGQYLKLFIAAWRHGGVLPEEHLWRAAGADSQAAFDSAPFMGWFLERITVWGKPYVVAPSVVTKFLEALDRHMQAKDAANQRHKGRDSLHTMQ
jgi:hypothetical protein